MYSFVYCYLSVSCLPTYLVAIMFFTCFIIHCKDYNHFPIGIDFFLISLQVAVNIGFSWCLWQRTHLEEDSLKDRLNIILYVNGQAHGKLNYFPNWYHLHSYQQCIRIFLINILLIMHSLNIKKFPRK